MSQSKLRQVLTTFENAVGPLSLPQIAQDLDVSQERLETMIQHWVRKGKIRQNAALMDCETCGTEGSCPYVMEVPRTFELAADDRLIPLHEGNISIGCQYKNG